MKKTKSSNDKSQLSSPARSLKRLSRSRPTPTENASQGSAGRTNASTSRKPNSSNLTPTRSSTRKSRATAKVAVIEDTSDSDWSPPPSIISSSPMKRSPEKRALRKGSNDKFVVPNGPVIDLTVPQTPKSSRKRRKLDSRLPVDLDTFINLCSDEEMNRPPQKKRKVSTLANDVIFISSDDEATLPRRQSIQRTPPSLELATDAQLVSEGEHVAEHSTAIADPVASDTSHEMDNNPNVIAFHPTPPPVSPPDNNSPDSVIMDFTASQNMAGIEEVSPKISRKLLYDFYQESLQNPPVRSLTSEDSCSTSFCNTSGPELKQRVHKVVHKQAKRALLTSLIFARPMRSLRTKGRPNANVIPQRAESSKLDVLIGSSVKETNSFDQGDTVPVNSRNIVLETLTSSTVSPPSSTATLQEVDKVPVNVVTPVDTTIYDDVRVSSASPVMEVDETEVEPAFSEDIDDSLKNPVPLADKSFANDVSSMEIVEEYTMHDTSTFHEGQADDHFAEAALIESELIPNSETPFDVTECVLRISTSPEPVGDIPIPSCPSVDNLQERSSSSQADEPLMDPTFRDAHLPSRDPSNTMDSNDSTDDTLTNSLPRETYPDPQTYINSSIFEVEHLPNLTFQNLFASNKFLDDVSDLAISLPCYPEQLHY